MLPRLGRTSPRLRKIPKRAGISVLSTSTRRGELGPSGPSVGQISGLGLRHTNPPDSQPQSSFPSKNDLGTGSEPDPEEPRESKGKERELSDREWEIRTGRTIDILTQTLPTFFNTGLMTTWDLETGDAFPARSLPSIPHLPSLPHLSDLPLPLPLPKPQKDTKQKDATRIPIFASEISLTYTPPTPLPHPFPRRLVLEGKSFYLASSVFIRHTLNTLYSDLGVTITKVAVSVPKTVSKSAEEAHPTPQPSASRNSGYTREKSFYIALRVTGKSRVSGTVGQWEVRSTYTFSPFDAKIIHHTVNGIEPAPEKGVFDALYRALRMPSLGRESQGALNYEKRGN